MRPRTRSELLSFCDTFVSFFGKLLSFGLLPWPIQRRVIWMRGLLALTWLENQNLLTSMKRLRDTFRAFRLYSRNFDYAMFQISCVVYVKFSLHSRHFYIGSTSQGIFGREQTRKRKYTQLCQGTTAFFEPALKYWHATNSFHQFVIVPVLHTTAAELLTEETTLQYTLRPSLNHPWINPILRKLRVGKPFQPAVCSTFRIFSGRRQHRRLSKYLRMKQPHCISQWFCNTRATFNTLFQLGHEGYQKFAAARVIRSSSVDIEYLYLLFRMTKFMPEPARTRAQSAVASALRFRGGDAPPQNTPLRVLALTDTMLANMKKWLQNFILRHEFLFPPCHKPKRPIVAAKGAMLSQRVFNFRKHLRTWMPDDSPSCTCGTTTGSHMVKFASELFPGVPALHAQLQDNFLPDFAVFLERNTAEFEKWSRKWKLPTHLMTYWQHFLVQEWQLLESNSKNTVWTTSSLKPVRTLHQRWVFAPADHHPNQAVAMCPCHWHQLLRRTFEDRTVFSPSIVGPVTIIQRIQSTLPRHLRRRYAWGFNWQAQLPAAYVLAKPSRHFQKARPIVNFSKAWPSRIGQALSIVLKMMCTTVFPTLAPDLNIRDVLHDVRRIFASYQDEPLTLQQLDIAGFYNQVEHGRIIQALEFIVHRYCFLQQVSPDSEIQASMRQHERIQRTFRGRYRAAGTNYKSVRIEDVVPLCKFLLTHSFLTVGYQAYRQIQGASMGSQWAPVMCAAVALVREWAFHQSLPRNVSLPFVIYRYVDNCIFIGAESQFTHSWSLLRTWPSFYSAPIELERVQTDEALGFRMCCQQRAITYIQPVARALRSPASSGPSQHVLTGFTARARIILRSTWPRSLICPQFQDLISVHLRMGFPLQLLLQELRMLVDSDNRVSNLRHRWQDFATQTWSLLV